MGVTFGKTVFMLGELDGTDDRQMDNTQTSQLIDLTVLVANSVKIGMILLLSPLDKEN